MINPEKLKLLASDKVKQNKVFIRQLKKTRPRDLDDFVHQKHEEIFTAIDCLECANCCKSISPVVSDKDIRRIAGHLKMKPAEFTRKYLQIDDEGDYIFKVTPCPFLMPDNYCMIYEKRPKACQEYPHTDRRRFYQLLNLSLKNSFICPAVFQLLSDLRDKFKKKGDY